MGSSMLLMCPSWMAAPTSVAVMDFTTDMDIQRVSSVLPSW